MRGARCEPSPVPGIMRTSVQLTEIGNAVLPAAALSMKRRLPSNRLTLPCSLRNFGDGTGVLREDDDVRTYPCKNGRAGLFKSDPRP